MSDLISRCELFNRLATIPAPPEANDLKAEIYKVIQSMETVDACKDPEQEYLDLICEIQHNAIKDGGCHVGTSSEWCIFGHEIKKALEGLHNREAKPCGTK